MKIILEDDCLNGKYRRDDEVTIDPTMGIAADDHILIRYDDGRADICRVVISPQSEIPLLETGDGKVHLSTDVKIVGKVIGFKRVY